MKILMSDFDETIYFEDNERVNNKNIEAIRKFVSYGNIFGIVTGRSYWDLKPYLEKYNILYSYLICNDGAKIFNNMDYCLDTILIDGNKVSKMLAFIEEKGWDYYLDDGYNKTTNVNDCVKIVVNCSNEEDKEEYVSLLKKVVPLHIYSSRNHINIVANGVDKEKAIKRLFNLEKLDYSKLKTIGDNITDYEMLKSFPGGIIKKHHPSLDELEKKEYAYLSDYIEELMKN